MSCKSSTPTKDYLKMEEYYSTLAADAEISMENSNKNDLSAVTFGSEKKAGVKQANDMSQTICMFRKYLLAKTQHNISKTNMEESEVVKKKSPPNSPLFMPPKLASNFSPRPSSLEQQTLLPSIRSDATEANSKEAKSSKSQLTIFYAGTVNVYDNVPIDKAQNVMLLAEESSSSRPLVIDMPKKDEKTPLHPPISKLEQELPIARKISLQHFIKKRRQRIVCKSPYLSPPNNTKNKKNMAIPKNF